MTNTSKAFTHINYFTAIVMAVSQLEAHSNCIMEKSDLELNIIVICPTLVSCTFLNFYEYFDGV